jgi:hypothetical protein
MVPPIARRTVLKGVALGVGGALVRPVLTFVPGLPSAAAATGFMMAGLDGGGGVNCLGIAPDGLAMVAGGDNNGPKVSADGATWSPAMGNLSRTLLASAAAVAWDPVEPSRVFLATHTRGGGGLFVSTDGALDWNQCTTVPQFNPGANRPRVVGHLLAWGLDGALYMGDVRGSVWRWASFGASGADGVLTELARVGSDAITSVVADPLATGRLYVASRTRCVQIDGADTAEALGAQVRPLTGAGAPARTEELAVLDEDGVAVVYAACWTQGVRRLAGAGDPQAAWAIVTPPGGSDLWCAIDAVREGPSTTVLVGSARPGELSGGGFDPVTGRSFGSLFLSSDAAATWVPITSGQPAEGVASTDTGDAGGPMWWGYLPAGQGGISDNRLGAATFVPEQVVIDPADPTRCFAVGTQGVFRFERSIATWYPAMTGLGVTTNNSVHCDPNDAGRMVVTNVDHVAFVSADGFVTARKHEHPDASLPNNGLTVAYDTATTPSRAFMAVGNDANSNGSVVFSADPSDLSAWRSLGRPAGTAQRPLGLAVRRVSGQVVALAAVQSRGVYRRRFDTASPPRALTSWVRVNSVAMTSSQASSLAPMCWEHATVVYLLDRASGLWRSRDAGASWQKIWAVKDNAEFEGFLAADPDDATGGTVIVSLGRKSVMAGAWRLSGCHVAGATVENGQVARTRLDKQPGVPFQSAGPVVARAGGRLWVFEEGEPELYTSTDAGATFTPSGDPFLPRAAKKVSGMDVAADGSIYLALKGPGLIVSRAS